MNGRLLSIAILGAALTGPGAALADDYDGPPADPTDLQAVLDGQDVILSIRVPAPAGENVTADYSITRDGQEIATMLGWAVSDATAGPDNTIVFTYEDRCVEAGVHDYELASPSGSSEGLDDVDVLTQNDGCEPGHDVVDSGGCSMGGRVPGVALGALLVALGALALVDRRSRTR